MVGWWGGGGGVGWWFRPVLGFSLSQAEQQTNTKHHGFRIQKKIQEPGGWVGWSKEILDPTLALQTTAWISESKLDPSVATKELIRVFFCPMVRRIWLGLA